MKLVISNDDFGLNFGLTKAAVDCFKKGTTTSVSILVNGCAFSYAADLLKTKFSGLGTGLHLNLTDGKANSSYLSDKNGNYKESFVSLYFGLLFKNKALMAAIRDDFEEQIKIYLDAGLKLDHIDSDKHVHMIPPIFETACSLCKKYGVSYIRIAKEPHYLTGSFYKDIRDVNPFLNSNIFKFWLLNSFAKENVSTALKYKIGFSDAFYGVLHTNEMDFTCFSSALENALSKKFKVVEVLSHPAYIDDKRDVSSISRKMEKYSKMKERLMEVETLKSEKLVNFLKSRKMSLTSFRSLQKEKKLF